MDDHKDYFIDTDSQDDTTPTGNRGGGNGTPDIEFASPATNGDSTAAPKPRRHRFRRWMAWALLIVIAAGALTFYIRYLNPYIVDARVRGYIVSVERRGIFFKTCEGVMVTESALVDTTRVYQRDMTFSITDPALFETMRDLQGTGIPVTVTYERYYGSLPWRGASTVVATAVTADDTAPRSAVSVETPPAGDTLPIDDTLPAGDTASNTANDSLNATPGGQL
ncbi:MAG: hypothetical protein NC117_06205 [Pseudoflavonifractor sp.]|nr:hypothetical protein [Pseudoflavonifractor sp.]